MIASTPYKFPTYDERFDFLSLCLTTQPTAKHNSIRRTAALVNMAARTPTLTTLSSSLETNTMRGTGGSIFVGTHMYTNVL